MLLFLRCAVPVVSVTSAAVLAFQGTDGWGWFLLLAFLTTM